MNKVTFFEASSMLKVTLNQENLRATMVSETKIGSLAFQSNLL